MVNISKIGDSTIKFTFTNNDRYLYNGEIEVPLNSLILVVDTSDMAVFKKIDGDVFVSFLIENSNFTSKSELEAWYKDNMVGATGGGGGGSITIDPSLDSDSTNAVANSAITEAVMVGEKMLYDEYTYESENYSYIPVVETFSPFFIEAAFGISPYVNLCEVQGFVEVESTQEEFFLYLTADTTTYEITNFQIMIGSEYITATLYGGRVRISTSNGSFKSIRGKDIIIRVPKILYGGTAKNVIMYKVYEEIQNTKKDVNTLYVSEPVFNSELNVEENKLTYDIAKIGKKGTTHTRISTVNFDDTIKYLDSKLGVYVTGDTYSTPIEYSGKITSKYLAEGTNGVEFKKNPQYTGTTDSVLCVRRYIDGEETYNWAYDSENDTFIPQQEIPSGLTLTYDGITVRITTDEGYIGYVRDYDWFADSSNPTDHTCMFQNIYAINNSYKLQDMIDNILSRLSALENNS